MQIDFILMSLPLSSELPDHHVAWRLHLQSQALRIHVESCHWPTHLLVLLPWHKIIEKAASHTVAEQPGGHVSLPSRFKTHFASATLGVWQLPYGGTHHMNTGSQSVRYPQPSHDGLCKGALCAGEQLFVIRRDDCRHVVGM